MSFGFLLFYICKCWVNGKKKEHSPWKGVLVFSVDDGKGLSTLCVRSGYTCILSLSLSHIVVWAFLSQYPSRIFAFFIRPFSLSILGSCAPQSLLPNETKPLQRRISYCYPYSQSMTTWPLCSTCLLPVVGVGHMSGTFDGVLQKSIRW